MVYNKSEINLAILTPLIYLILTIKIITNQNFVLAKHYTQIN